MVVSSKDLNDKFDIKASKC